MFQLVDYNKNKFDREYLRFIGDFKINNRVFSRIKINVKVQYEFVNKDEKELECTERAFETEIVNISVQGLGLNSFPDISNDDRVQLLAGEIKIRLNFKLEPGAKPVALFALLVRYRPELNIFGLEFVDIPVDSFINIRDTIDEITGDDIHP